MPFDLMAASPTPSAWVAQPMTACEIDAHPDAARIWATVMALRSEVAAEVDLKIEAVCGALRDVEVEIDVGDDGATVILDAPRDLADPLAPGLGALERHINAALAEYEARVPPKGFVIV